MKISLPTSQKLLYFDNKNLLIGTNENANLIIFAPNGCGKTTIFNGIKNKQILVNNKEYNEDVFNAFDISHFNDDSIETFISMILEKKPTNDEFQIYFNKFNNDDIDNDINLIIENINNVLKQNLVLKKLIMTYLYPMNFMIFLII